MNHVLAAAHHQTVEMTVTAVIASVFTAVILVFLVLYLARWQRVKGATSRGDAINRAFGPGANKVVMYVCLAFAAVAFVMVIIMKTTGTG